MKAADTGHNFWIILLGALAVFLCVQVIQDMILTPRIMGKAVGLPPFLILLALSVWGYLLGIIGMIIDCFKIIGVVFSIWMFSSKLGIIVLFLLPVIYFITRLFQKRMLEAQIENLVLVGKVNNHISESVKSIRMIKSFSKESYMEKKYNKYLLDNY